MKRKLKPSAQHVCSLVLTMMSALTQTFWVGRPKAPCKDDKAYDHRRVRARQVWPSVAKSLYTFPTNSSRSSHSLTVRCKQCVQRGNQKWKPGKTLTLKEFAIGHSLTSGGCFFLLCLRSYQKNPLSSGPTHCNACDLQENELLRVTCRSLGCGRQQFGGIGRLKARSWVGSTSINIWYQHPNTKEDWEEHDKVG